MPYQTVSLNFYTLTVVPVSNSGPFLITYLPGAQQAGTPDLMPAILAGNKHLHQISGSLFSAVLGLCNVAELYEDKEGYSMIRQINGTASVYWHPGKTWNSMPGCRLDSPENLSL